VSWDYRVEDTAARQLRALGPSAAAKIFRFLDGRIRGCSDPTQFGKPLRGDKKGFWRYRLRDWRILCRFENGLLIVVVVALGHRSTVYNE
jgi:mRNA interferase RelE/StbE